MGYTVAYLVYQIGTLITTGSFGDAVIPGFIAVGLFIGFIVYLMRKNKVAVSDRVKEAA